MDLKELYNQEKQTKEQDALDEATIREYLGPIIEESYSTRYIQTIYDTSSKASLSAEAQDVLKQAVALIKLEVWREDGYRRDRYETGVAPIKLNSISTDKKNVRCCLRNDQTFVHQYAWPDQSSHLSEEPIVNTSREVPKKLFGGYDAVFKEMIEREDARLKQIEKLSCGSQKYVKLSFAPHNTMDGEYNHMYLFTDGNVYLSKLSSASDWKFARAFDDEHLEETGRSIVQQIMKMNGD